MSGKDFDLWFDELCLDFRPVCLLRAWLQSSHLSANLRQLWWEGVTISQVTYYMYVFSPNKESWEDCWPHCLHQYVRAIAGNRLDLGEATSGQWYWWWLFFSRFSVQWFAMDRKLIWPKKVFKKKKKQSVPWIGVSLPFFCFYRLWSNCMRDLPFITPTCSLSAV